MTPKGPDLHSNVMLSQSAFSLFFLFIHEDRTLHQKPLRGRHNSAGRQQGVQLGRPRVTIKKRRQSRVPVLVPFQSARKHTSQFSTSLWLSLRSSRCFRPENLTHTKTEGNGSFVSASKRIVCAHDLCASSVYIVRSEPSRRDLRASFGRPDSCQVPKPQPQKRLVTRVN